MNEHLEESPGSDTRRDRNRLRSPVHSPALFDFYDPDDDNVEDFTPPTNDTTKPVKLTINTRPRSTALSENYLTPTTSNTSSSLTSSNTPNGSTNFKNLEDILKFPIESSYAYSYAHLSPNSLALRLNVLKRSLEILKDRPELFNSYNLLRGSKDTSTDQRRASMTKELMESKFEKPIKTLDKSLYSHSNNSSEYFNDTKYKLQSNASLAALSALLRPQVKRSDSFPVNQVYGKEVIEKRKTSLNTTSNKVLPNHSPASADSFLNDDLKDLISLLDNDSDLLLKNSEIASTLHHLSLSTNKEAEKKNLKSEALKNKLLYALATPFVETSVLTSSLLQNGPSLHNQGGTATPLASSFSHQSTAALNMLSSNAGANSSNRPFHLISSGKHSLPQSVFTVEIDNPWSVKAANDLACLMFGVLKNMIKNLTLMDLIAPQFRHFVTDRLTNYIARNLDLSLRSKRTDADPITNNNILFAGEIVAILRPGDQNFAWTSIWAKRKGNFIICMFDQIPCDAFDIMILCDKEKYYTEPYNIDSVNEIAGSLVRQFDISKMKKLGDISDSLEGELRHELADNNLSPDFNDSEKINKTRYYTLQFNGEENIPCAITSNPMETNEKNFEIKVKIHSLPYIAGLFVIDSSNYNILSCNTAIARNLFGRSSDDLNEKSIDTIIPNFTKILHMGLDDNSNNFELVPGLVLPEHFFRKYDSILRFQNGEHEKEETEEELFFHSHGIKALHRDGKYIFVDVQLRALSNETLVVWITYSRLSNKSNVSNELEKLNSNRLKMINPIPEESMIEAITPPKSSKSSFLAKIGITKKPASGVLAKNRVWPSQLDLMSQDVGFDASSDIARKSSTRKARNDSFGIPVSYLTNFEKKPRAISSLYNSANVSVESINSTVKEENEEDESTEASGSAPLSAFTDATSNKEEIELFKDGHKEIFSEQEILQVETEEIDKMKANSTHWPKLVGKQRRTKKFSEFNVLKPMGEGAYGKVVLVQHKEDPLYKIIIKCINKERILVDTWVRDRNLGTIPSEIQVMSFLNDEPHPNIMQLIDFFEDTEYYYLETPIFGDPPAIDLFDYIEIKKNMTESECQSIFKQVVLTIYHLHQNGIVHRDIKDENVIVDERGIIKVIDFGSAAYTRQGPFDVFVGTIDYASPEVLKGEKYEGKAQDIWALGILLYTMLYKENPFYNVDEIMDGDLRIPYVLSEGLTDLVKKILIRDIELRPTITDIVESDWLKL